LLIASTRSRGFLGANFLAAAVKFRKELMHLKSSHESASEGKTVNKGELKGLHTPRGADFRAELRWRAAAHEFSSGCFFRNSISGAPAPGGEQTVVRNSQEAWPSLLLTFSKVSWRLLEMFRSSGSEPLQTELCENPILSRRVITPTFRGACLSSTSHMPIGIAFNLTLKSYPTRCLPNRSRVLAKPQLKRMNKAEGREWLPGG